MKKSVKVDETKRTTITEEQVTIGKHTLMKPIAVNIKTIDGEILHGFVNLAFQERVSDFFIGSDARFFILFGAKVAASSEEKVLIINKSHVVWIEPMEEIGFGTVSSEKQKE